MTYFTEGEALAFATAAGINYVPLYQENGHVWLFDARHNGKVRSDAVGVGSHLVADWFAFIFELVAERGTLQPPS
jgi:hypothetical protein